MDDDDDTTDFRTKDDDDDTTDFRTKDDDDTIDFETRDDDDDTIDYETKDDEDTIDFRTKLRAEAVSVARQFYCFCSIMIFPALTEVYDFISTETERRRHHPLRLLPTEVQHASVEFFGNKRLSSAIGQVIGAVFLIVVGRKYTVIAANLSHLALLTCSYLSGVNGVNQLTPFTLSMLNFAVKNVSFVAFCIYTVEIASPTYRAFFLGCYNLNAAVMAEQVSSAAEQLKVNQLIRNCAIVTAVSSLFAVYTPETPFWQALKGDEDEAEKTLNWIRAGKLNPAEFDQMLEKADDINDNNGILKQVLSQTLVVGAILSLSMISSGIPTCATLHALLNDFYYPETKASESEREYVQDLFRVYRAGITNQQRDLILGPALFLTLNFFLTRKVFYGVSYAGIILVFMVIRLKLGNLDVWATTMSFCSIVRTAGVLPLGMVLPVEIYPATVREIGIAINGTLRNLVIYLYHRFYSLSKPDFPDHEWVYATVSYTCFYLSLIMVPFMLTIMPETQNINIYQLDHLKIELPNRRTTKDADKEYYDEYL